MHSLYPQVIIYINEIGQSLPVLWHTHW
jgi:hypothetical protein